MFGKRRDPWSDSTSTPASARPSTAREPRTGGRHHTAGSSTDRTGITSALRDILYLKVGYRTPDGGITERIMTPEEAREDDVLQNLSAWKDTRRFWRLPDEYLTAGETIPELTDQKVIEAAKEQIEKEATAIGANKAYITARITALGLDDDNILKAAERAAAYLGMIAEEFKVDKDGNPLIRNGEWVLATPSPAPASTT